MAGAIRCEYCGKFISYQDIEDEKVKVEYTPDSHFTGEGVDFICSKCNNERGDE